MAMATLGRLENSKDFDDADAVDDEGPNLSTQTSSFSCFVLVASCAVQCHFADSEVHLIDVTCAELPSFGLVPAAIAA